MIPENRDDLYAVAGEYVLGTLDAESARDIEAALPSNDDLRRAVAFWEGELHPLSRLAAPAEPPARIWAAIEARVGRPTRERPAVSRAWRSPAPWRWATFGTAAVAAGLALYIALARPTPAPPLVAVLHAPQQTDGRWVATTGRNGLSIKSLAGTKPPAGRSFELWAIPPGSSRPQSLGVIPTSGALRVAALPTGVREGTTLAISVEPPGGSPTKQPTGPVVFLGEVRAM